MSEKANFTIVLHGVTGHGGTPQKCVDVIVPAAAIIQGIQSVVSRNTAPEDPLVCAVCSIHAGTPENFSPDLLTMTGSIRAFLPRHPDDGPEPGGTTHPRHCLGLRLRL